MLADHRDGLSSSSVLAWSSIAQSVCQRAFSLLAIWCLGPRVQILHSAEEHNLSPFDLNIACLCQSIEFNNNKYVCRRADWLVQLQLALRMVKTLADCVDTMSGLYCTHCFTPEEELGHWTPVGVQFVDRTTCVSTQTANYHVSYVAADGVVWWYRCKSIMRDPSCWGGNNISQRCR